MFNLNLIFDMRAISTLLFLTIILASCGQKLIDPEETITCPQLGLGESHPKHQMYQNILDDYLDQLNVPGISAVIYTPDDSIWAGTAGLADREQAIGMNTCHVLYSGSVAKVYTVTAALRLYEEGHLNLDAQIDDYLPASIADNLPNGKLATVRQLMNHEAGMPDHDDEKDLEKYLKDHDGKLPSPADQLAYLYDNEPRFAPGDSVAYSSAHTLALAIIIDNIEGSSHSETISREIIQKLNLTETYYKNETGYPEPINLVKGYLNSGNRSKDFSTESVNYCDGSHGDAGIVASAHDYYLFLRGLMEGKVVSKSTLDEMTAARWLFDDGTHGLGFGLGLFIIKKDDEVVKIGHSGMTLGGLTHVYYYPQTGSYIVLCTNTMLGKQSHLNEWGAEMLVGTPTESIMAEFETLILD